MPNFKGKGQNHDNGADDRSERRCDVPVSETQIRVNTAHACGNHNSQNSQQETHGKSKKSHQNSRKKHSYRYQEQARLAGDRFRREHTSKLQH